MTSNTTLPYGTDFVYRVQDQFPFLVNDEFPVIIADRIEAP